MPIIRRNSPHGAQIDSQPHGEDGVHVQISHPSWGSATVKTSEKSGSKEPTLVTLETGLSVGNTPKKKIVKFPDELEMEVEEVEVKKRFGFGRPSKGILVTGIFPTSLFVFSDASGTPSIAVKGENGTEPKISLDEFNLRLRAQNIPLTVTPGIDGSVEVTHEDQSRAVIEKSGDVQIHSSSGIQATRAFTVDDRTILHVADVDTVVEPHQVSFDSGNNDHSSAANDRFVSQLDDGSTLIFSNKDQSLKVRLVTGEEIAAEEFQKTHPTINFTKTSEEQTIVEIGRDNKIEIISQRLQEEITALAKAGQEAADNEQGLLFEQAAAMRIEAARLAEEARLAEIARVAEEARLA
ncbi:MAG: hypothetical protein F2684_05225, partial [Actinobacteria bacterium]|nr:hypothetical protein [Actinomycetota bacterium]